MTNNGTTTEQAPVKAGENLIPVFERIERLIENRCDEILKVAGKGNFDHPLMAGFFELQSLNGKIIGLKNIQHEKNRIAKA